MDTSDENIRVAGEEKISSDTLNSPLQVFDEDLLLSDQMLHDMMPGCGSPGVEDFTTLQDFSFFDLPMAAEHDSRLSFSPTAVSTRVGSQTELMNHASCMHHASIIDWVSYLTLNSFRPSQPSQESHDAREYYASSIAFAGFYRLPCAFSKACVHAPSRLGRYQ